MSAERKGSREAALSLVKYKVEKDLGNILNIKRLSPSVCVCVCLFHLLQVCLGLSIFSLHRTFMHAVFKLVSQQSLESISALTQICLSSIEALAYLSSKLSHSLHYSQSIVIGA